MNLFIAIDCFNEAEALKPRIQQLVKLFNAMTRFGFNEAEALKPRIHPVRHVYRRLLCRSLQ